MQHVKNHIKSRTQGDLKLSFSFNFFHLNNERFLKERENTNVHSRLSAHKYVFKIPEDQPTHGLELNLLILSGSVMRPPSHPHS